jgi:hypothetical protein
MCCLPNLGYVARLTRGCQSSIAGHIMVWGQADLFTKYDIYTIYEMSTPPKPRTVAGSAWVEGREGEWVTFSQSHSLMSISSDAERMQGRTGCTAIHLRPKSVRPPGLKQPTSASDDTISDMLFPIRCRSFRRHTFSQRGHWCCGTQPGDPSPKHSGGLSSQLSHGSHMQSWAHNTSL